MGYQRTDCITKLNYYKVKITENSGTEWDEIVRETVWKIDKKALKKVILSFYNFFLIIAYTNFYPGYIFGKILLKKFETYIRDIPG